MAKSPQFLPKETEKGWQISIPANMSGTGKVRRRFFGTKGEAERFGKEQRGAYQRGERAGRISQELSVLAAQAQKILAPYNLNVLDAAKAIAAQYEAKGTVETFRERYDRFRAQQEQHWRPRYATDMGKIPKWVGEEFMEMKVASITTEVMNAALRENGAVAASTVKARGMRVSSVLMAVGKKRHGGKIEIMTVSECAKMLRACHNEMERRTVALLLFAGIRPDVLDGEITRMDWSCVGATEIYIAPDVSKTGTDRHIPITPRLRRLLRGHPKEGRVTPARWKLIYTRVRKGAGISEKHDITRHTFASHFLAAYGEDATKQAMGHSANSQTLFRHYRRAVTESAGKKYFR